MRRKEFYEEQKLKRLVKIFSITLVLSIVVFLSIFVMYNKKLKAQSESMISDLGKLNDIVSNDELETTSFSDDLSVNKVQSENVVSNSTNNSVSNKNNVVEEKVNTVSENKVSKEAVTAQVENKAKEEVVEEKVLKFEAPVSGEIIKDFTMDTLSYSKTLEEWTTHPGVDIKADKTTVVAAAETGVVESIKNDPRYGLTIIIAHSSGFKTIYSNLLTTEFVKENETVEKGQTIATVGDSSSFEISDDSHLHFEMYKDGKLVNPTIYLK